MALTPPVAEAANVADNAPSTVVRVLEADPDLGTGIAGAELDLASAAVIAPAYRLRRGAWRFLPPPERGALGALILDGLIIVRIQVGRRAHIELLGEGDVISPWVGAGNELTDASLVSSSVVSPVQMALLDRRFALRAARWPEIESVLIQRLIVRARRLSFQAAINAVPRIDQRLQATLWALAQRLGRVTPEGITVTLPISHSQLADMVGAQRPSVSVALRRLQADGKVLRANREEWLLRGDAPEILTSLARQADLHV